MAKNCDNCSLPISGEQLFLRCESCNTNSIHKHCMQLLKTEKLGISKQWICQSCDAKQSVQNTSCDTCNNYVDRLNDLLLRINTLQEEQKGIVTSIVNTCNDTINEYEESVGKFTSMLASFQSQLGFTNDNKNENPSPGQSTADVQRDHS